jgi:hypothetical protein
MQEVMDRPPIGWRHLPNGGPHPLPRLVREHNPDFRECALPAAEAKAEEVDLLRATDRAFLFIDLKPQTLLQEPPERGHNP